MKTPIPTPIYRFIHIDNLNILLHRRGIHSPNRTPRDGLIYKTIHNVEIQQKRNAKSIPCSPGGVIHDYVPFYFGYLSPMMLNLKTDRVSGYSEGQEPLIYLVSTVQTIHDNGNSYVFSDGHGIATFTSWYNDLRHLNQIDWNMVYKRYWADDPENDPDRQRRKQAEFLVRNFCDWSLIKEITVINKEMQNRVQAVFETFPQEMKRTVTIKRDWYYY